MRLRSIFLDQDNVKSEQPLTLCRKYTFFEGEQCKCFPNDSHTCLLEFFARMRYLRSCAWFCFSQPLPTYPCVARNAVRKHGKSDARPNSLASHSLRITFTRAPKTVWFSWGLWTSSLLAKHSICPVSVDQAVMYWLCLFVTVFVCAFVLMRIPSCICDCVLQCSSELCNNAWTGNLLNCLVI